MNSVPCVHCQGTGQRKLTERERKTLTVIKRGGAWWTSAEIRSRMPSPVTPNAMANRLAKLYGLGLLRRRRHDARTYQYQAV